MPHLEEWRPVEGLHGRYEVSNKGRVKSLARDVIRVYHDGERNLPLKERILKHWLTHGYPIVAVANTKVSVHRLVAKAFCEGYQEGLHVNHKDSNPQNNNHYNLEWVTHRENMVHSVEFGNKKTGEDSKSSKLSNIESDFVKLWADKGYTQKDIGDVFGIHQCHVSRIVNNKRRKNQYKGEL